jgi:hypothetical protein
MHGFQLPVKPAIQTQDASDVLETGEVEFAGHDEHTDIAFEAAYFPGSQFVHSVDAAAATEPAWHSMHAGIASCTLKCVPAGQDEHTDAPIEVVYSPGSQFVHALDPAAAEYEPTAQLTHTELPLVDLYVPDGHASQRSRGQTPSIPATMTSLMIRGAGPWEMCRN